jgi:hypothetical protein
MGCSMTASGEMAGPTRRSIGATGVRAATARRRRGNSGVRRLGDRRDGPAATRTAAAMR